MNRCHMYVLLGLKLLLFVPSFCQIPVAFIKASVMASLICIMTDYMQLCVYSGTCNFTPGLVRVNL